MLVNLLKTSPSIHFTTRMIGTSDKYYGRSRTNESKPIPGSLEQTDPLKWADRLYKLHNIKDDASEVPSQLNMVCRTTNKGIQYYYRCILQKYGISGTKNFQYRLVKNTPSVNDDLRKVAHLIKIVPVQFPNGAPQTHHDCLNAQLRPNGEFILHTGVKVEGEVVDEHDHQSAKDLIFAPSRHAKRTLTEADFYRTNMTAWRSNVFLSEHYTSHYQYEHNQDGLEYRYSGLWKFTDALKQSMARRHNQDGTVRMNRNHEADWNTYPWRNY